MKTSNKSHQNLSNIKVSIRNITDFASFFAPKAVPDASAVALVDFALKRTKSAPGCFNSWDEFASVNQS